MQNTQTFDGLDRFAGSVGPYPAPTRYSQAISVGYDNAPHLATGPAERRGDPSQRQFDSNRTPRITQYNPIALGPPLLEQYPPVIPEVPNDGLQSHVLPHNVAPSRGNPSIVHSGMSVGEDLKNLAIHYLHNPNSYVDKVRMRQSRSGAVKMLIFLLIDEQYAPAIPEVLNNHHPTHTPLPHNMAESYRGESSLVHARISVGEDLKNLASFYLHNPGSHVDKLRMRRSQSGAVKVLIFVEINDIM